MRAFLGLGSNLGDRAARLQQAIAGLPDVVAVSPVYETDPVGGPEQGLFLNCVVELRTDRSARDLLDACRRVEQAAARVRVERWGARTLDADVLWTDGPTLAEPDLIVPHPRMWVRRFVLAPLRDLAPDLVTGAMVAAADGAVRRVATPTASGGGSGSVRIIGPGRAGGSFAGALAAAGWTVVDVLGRGDDLAGAAVGVDLVLIATPDAAIASVAAAIEPVATTVVAHVAGSLGLDVLAPHERRGAVHPLVALPNPAVGTDRLRAGPWFAVAGDSRVARIVADLGGHGLTVADADRAAYHAAACIASNHLVALLAQTERVAAAAGVPLAAFFDLVQGTLDNVRALGPAAAITGPASRGDRATIERHRAALAAIDPAELPAYDALVEQITRNLV